MAEFERSEFLLRRRARRAYERGRLEGAALRGLAAAAIAIPGFLACGRTAISALCLAGFSAAVATARFRGGEVEDGVRAGAIAGILPCLLPIALRAVNADLCDVLFSRGPWLCAASGAAAGAILGFRSRAGRGFPFWAGAIVTLGLASALGCLPAGAMGFSGLLAGIVAGGAPVLLIRRAEA